MRRGPVTANAWSPMARSIPYTTCTRTCYDMYTDLLRHVHGPVSRRPAQSRRLDTGMGALRKSGCHEARLLELDPLPAESVHPDGQRSASARHARPRTCQPQLPPHADHRVVQSEDLQTEGPTDGAVPRRARVIAA